MNNKILIATALKLEFKAVESFLTNTQAVKHPETGSSYKKGTYQTQLGINYEVLLIETGAGNNRATDETGRAISFFKPAYAFFVGVAGGIKDVELGDVVASTKVIGFEVGKAVEQFKSRTDTVAASYILEQLAKHVNREETWLNKLKVSNDEKTPNAFVQPIAAGEKVVASTQSEAYKYLKEFCSDALAIDMEGIGFLIAARTHHIHAIEVRGISDLIEGKADADAGGSQPIAARNASAFTFAIIDEIEQPKQAHLQKDITSIQFKNKLVKKLTELYEQGPEQDDIWKRAGGDVSILSNSASRKSQWYSAIDNLSKGGGGKGISMESLINEVREDFPESEFVKEMFN